LGFTNTVLLAALALRFSRVLQTLLRVSLSGYMDLPATVLSLARELLPSFGSPLLPPADKQAQPFSLLQFLQFSRWLCQICCTVICLLDIAGAHVFVMLMGLPLI
jgi:hypothetical protein